MKLAHLVLVIGVLAASLSCGGGSGKSAASQGGGSLSGNWLITLTRHANPDVPLYYTGFLVQSGNAVTGSLILGTGEVGTNCNGVGPITGTVSGQNVSFTINEFGQEWSLTGSLPSGNTPMGGQFSTLAGGCTNFANTGTWTATPIAPVSGNFHGEFVSVSGNGTLEVTGTLTQGANMGLSTAMLNGTIVATGAPHFCSYLPPSTLDPVTQVPISNTITGVISGTTLSLSLFRPDGSQIAQIGQIGVLNNSPAPPLVTVSPDGTTITGQSYTFAAISSTDSCPGDSGTMTLVFK